jgi:hypothetical protein
MESRPEDDDEDAHLKLFLVRQDTPYKVRYIPYDIPRQHKTRRDKTSAIQSASARHIVVHSSQKRTVNDDEDEDEEVMRCSMGC